MTEFFDVAIANAFRQILGGFGLMFLFAFLMWTMSQRRRGVGGGKFGNSYYYFVAPGVMFHELGHALGCLLTMTKITRFVPFHPKGDRLGYVAYAMPVGARFGAIRIFIISTGPVWLGCFVITLLGWILGGNGFWPNYHEAFGANVPGIGNYLSAVFFTALRMLVSMICVWKWTSPLYLVLLYLLFCITSEITLSPSDLAGMWRGAFVLIFFVILLNLIPGVNAFALKLSDWLAPCLFSVHSVLMFVLLMDITFYIVFKMITFPFGGRRR